MEPVTTEQLPVTVHVHHIDGGERQAVPEQGEVREHLVAELALVPADDRQSRGLRTQGKAEIRPVSEATTPARSPRASCCSRMTCRAPSPNSR